MPLVPGGVTPPASIDDTCAKDVTASLMDWLYSLPNASPSRTVVDFGKGCHDGAFFTAQESPSLAFLARHLTR